MSNSTQNAQEVGTSAAQAPKRRLYAACLRKLCVSAEFIGNGWREVRPVIITVDIKADAKDHPLVFPRLEQMSGQIEQMLKCHAFESLDLLVQCVPPLIHVGNDELIKIVAQTPTAVPRAEEGLTRVVKLTRTPPREGTEHNGGWVISSHERLLKSLKVSCKIGHNWNEPNARQILSLDIRIIGDLDAQAPNPNSAKCAEMWCRLAKSVCEYAEGTSFASAEQMITLIVKTVLAHYPVSKVGVACERPSPLSGLPFVQGEVLELIRDRQTLNVVYLPGLLPAKTTKADTSQTDSHAG